MKKLLSVLSLNLIFVLNSFSTIEIDFIDVYENVREEHTKMVLFDNPLYYENKLPDRYEPPIKPRPDEITENMIEMKYFDDINRQFKKDRPLNFIIEYLYDGSFDQMISKEFHERYDNYFRIMIDYSRLPYEMDIGGIILRIDNEPYIIYDNLYDIDNRVILKYPENYIDGILNADNIVVELYGSNRVIKRTFQNENHDKLYIFELYVSLTRRDLINPRHSLVEDGIKEYYFDVKPNIGSTFTDEK